MGSPVCGQLGNPQADGKLPTSAEGKLAKSFVEEIACGAYHVAVLTSRTEVYTWGKGANGQLGHGKAIETDASVSRRGFVNQGPSELADKDEKMDLRPHAHLSRYSSIESLKQMESKYSKRNKKLELNSSCVSPVPNGTSPISRRQSPPCSTNTLLLPLEV
ncbi:hypothetical protein QQ045_025540 [Rhodiola kirilowii]